MAKKLLKYCFPYLVSFYVLMLISYGVGAIGIILPKIIPWWTFIPNTSIPYDLIGWWYMASASIYCGGQTMLNFMTTKNLHDISKVDLGMDKLSKITYMNYFACFYCLVIKILGVDIPLEAIVSSAGACTALVVISKKGSQTTAQLSPAEDIDQDGIRDEEQYGSEELLELRNKYDEKQKSLDDITERISHSKCLMYGQLTPEQENALTQLMVAVKSNRNLDIQVRNGQITSRMAPESKPSSLAQELIRKV
jgi:hypothetical protein